MSLNWKLHAQKLLSKTVRQELQKVFRLQAVKSPMAMLSELHSVLGVHLRSADVELIDIAVLRENRNQSMQVSCRKHPEACGVLKEASLSCGTFCFWDCYLVKVSCHWALGAGCALLSNVRRKPWRRLRARKQIHKCKPTMNEDTDPEMAPEAEAAKAVETEAQAEPWDSQVLLAVLRFYREFLSPLLPPNCRYAPSCSRRGKLVAEVFWLARNIDLAGMVSKLWRDTVPSRAVCSLYGDWFGALRWCLVYSKLQNPFYLYYWQVCVDIFVFDMISYSFNVSFEWKGIFQECTLR